MSPEGGVGRHDAQEARLPVSRIRTQLRLFDPAPLPAQGMGAVHPHAAHPADHSPPGTSMGSNESDGDQDDTNSKVMKHRRVALFSILLLGGLGAQPATAEVPPEQANVRPGPMFGRYQ